MVAPMSGGGPVVGRRAFAAGLSALLLACASVGGAAPSTVGQVMTVTGPVSPDRLGPTLMHEHLFVDWFENMPAAASADDVPPAVRRRMQQAGWPVPRDAEQARFFNSPDLTLDMIDELRRDWRLRTNYRIDDEALARREVAAFAAAGGRTIVDLTPYGLGRDPVRLRRLAVASGLTIVMGTGWYRWPFHPDAVAAMSVDDLAAIMIRDVERGGADGIRAGIIGEIPVDSRSIRIPAGADPSDEDVRARSGAARKRLLALPVAERDAVDPREIYDPAELKVLRAAARASRRTGAALSLHGVDPWIGYLRIVAEEGADLHRVIVGHADYILADPDLLRMALARGVTLQADYRLQYYPNQSPVGDVGALVAGIAWAVAHGHRDQILLSLDICNKVGLRHYGGGGYATLHNHILPKLRAAGVGEEDIRHILVDNPRRLLTMASPRP
ncbi:phosphotriesterase family protein [Rhizorhabdus wittichii]